MVLYKPITLLKVKRPYEIEGMWDGDDMITLYQRS